VERPPAVRGQERPAHDAQHRHVAAVGPVSARGVKRQQWGSGNLFLLSSLCCCTLTFTVSHTCPSFAGLQEVQALCAEVRQG
jgi:hypothetical protein